MSQFLEKYKTSAPKDVKTLKKASHHPKGQARRLPDMIFATLFIMLIFTISFSPSVCVAGTLTHSNQGIQSWLKPVAAGMGVGSLWLGLVGLIIYLDEKKKKGRVYEAFLLIFLLAIIVGPIFGFLAAIVGILFGNVGGVAMIAVIGFVLGILVTIKKLKSQD